MKKQGPETKQQHNLSPQKRKLFFASLSETANVTTSATAAGVTRQAVYALRQRDKEFAEQWEQALNVGVGALEDEAVRRAKEGVDEPVFYQGKQCGTVKKYSDTLLIFLLKANKPEKYRDRYEFTGKDGEKLIPDDTEGRITGIDTARRIAFLLQVGAIEADKQKEDG